MSISFVWLRVLRGRRFQTVPLPSNAKDRAFAIRDSGSLPANWRWRISDRRGVVRSFGGRRRSRVLCGEGHSALHPSGVPKSQQHLRSCSEPLRREIKCLGRSLSSKSSGFFKRVHVFHQAIRFSEISNIADKGIIEPLRSL